MALCTNRLPAPRRRVLRIDPDTTKPGTLANLPIPQSVDHSYRALAVERDYHRVHRAHALRQRIPIVSVLALERLQCVAEGAWRFLQRFEPKLPV
ncbi:MAG: hypothetical protein EOP82_32340 [Variovorax sp.]|nr:MAG: hypothetical protein EOP82_32340 [Variovorax sp.]